MIAQRNYLFILILLLAGCTAQQERPSVFESLIQAEATIVSLQETLQDALRLGTVDVSSREYADVYAGLQRANLLLDSAWTAYHGGDLQQADQLREFSVDAYMAIRPMLYELAGGTP